jgi:O-acetyl-ADP-ribose deacetylase (regulator of RNase III)
VKADITLLDVDAIVNAANSTLLGGGGVDGAIHRAAGPGLAEECRGLGGCPTGEARISRGYDLPCRYVIHAVAPVYDGGGFQEAEMLGSAYEWSLRLAESVGVESVAFPCLATGAFGYPAAAACEIAIDVAKGWVASHQRPREIVFCCFRDEDEALYRQRLTP